MRAVWRPVITALCALAVSLLAVACGGNGGGGPGSQPAATNSDGETPSLQSAMVRVIRSTEPEVVQIQSARGLGSGVVFDGNADIVTNAHVVGSSRDFRITASDGHRYRGTLLGSYQPGDLAVVKAHGANLKAAGFGRSSELKVGDVVLAIGNPLGLRSSVTNGIVSALGRTVAEPGGRVLPNVIQTSAAINPGNSGGALVDLKGDVVGIPTLAAVDPELGGSAAPGIGFAIPSDVVRDIAGQIIKHGHVVDAHRAYLGVQLAASPQIKGAVIAAVAKAGPAGNAGIRPGDVIVAIGGHTVSSPADASSILASMRPGQIAAIKLGGTNGRTRTVRVRLGQYPSKTGG